MSRSNSDLMAFQKDQPCQLRRMLIFGAGGNLGGTKLRPTYEKYKDAGVEIYACDVVPEAEVAKVFNGFKEYFDLRNETDRESLTDIGHRRRFDLAYEATWPDARLMNLLNWESICRYMLATKPFIAIEQYDAMRALMELAAYKSVVKKFVQHDHFVNKPAVEAVLSILPEAHARYGKFSRLAIFITEQRTVNEESKRLKALKGGMIPDLGSHAIIIIQRLVPVGLIWEDGEGNRIKRLSREIEPTACVRAQMKNAMCDQDVDTATVAEYRITEILTMIGKRAAHVGNPVKNVFFALVVCGKGLRATGDTDRDLKAVEIAFQGQGQATGVIDLETNTLNEVLQTVPGVKPLDEELRMHRGINRPMLHLLSNWKEFGEGNGLRQEWFQAPLLVWENLRILWQTKAIARKGILPTYAARDLIHNFVNQHIGAANAFRYFGYDGSGWPTKEEPLHLMRGRASSSSIP